MSEFDLEKYKHSVAETERIEGYGGVLTPEEAQEVFAEIERLLTENDRLKRVLKSQEYGLRRLSKQ